MGTSFLNDDLQRLREHEFLHCQQTAARTGKTLTVGYANALRLYGVPIGEHCRLSVDDVHVCVDGADERPNMRGVHAHIWKAQSRTHTLGDFRLASPTAAWAQIAPFLPLQDLIAVGCMLMSKNRRRRVATLDDFEEYLAANQRFKGRKQCQAALPHLVEGTDSPAEANLLAFLSIHGIRGIKPNFEVTLPHGDLRFIDLALPAIRLGLEYQGSYHAGIAQMREDANRMNQLIDLGWVIIQVTVSDMRTAHASEQLLVKIQRAISRQTALMRLIQNT
ncbi:hypothetical protein PT282_03360 [Bifidobacterium sp. ESL0763]|uniref:hypothetical protein n=1 Tax=Bifidobacterium sp. ESL0763 TaxID=2983227 RepID=UPI0023F64D18|nr:hypothetical protein [Bifidobacterium sp. ESL0763]MDF7663706.1 hypothetical protein [Bifidobacterium sp. ESL0763]